MNDFKTQNIIKLFIKNYKLIVVVIFIAAITSYLATFLLKEKFKSVAVVYPVNVYQNSEESSTEQLIQYLLSDEVKQKLSPAAYNQPQIIGSSQLLVFCAWTDITDKDVIAYIDNIATKRNTTIESLSGFKAMIDSTVNN